MNTPKKQSSPPQKKVLKTNAQKAAATTHSSKKKKIFIKKRVEQKKDISDHFKPSPFSNFSSSARNRPSGRSVHQHRAKPSPRQDQLQESLPHQPASSINLDAAVIMQAVPPTAAQARGRTVRGSSGRNEFPRHERDKRQKGEDESLFENNASKASKSSSDLHVPRRINITENLQVSELAKKMNLRPSEVIGRLMKMGEMVTINKTISAETATLFATEYDCEVNVVSLYDETVVEEDLDHNENRKPRPPVVTIMGHVDHGKTLLLDTIRQSNIIAGEAGSITQHIGAYQVKTKDGKITFLDTPGHEAFSAMRARGASVTDIVVLVIAVDDGPKRQTLEAIDHAREAKVPIIVAINKIDIPGTDVEKVKKELSSHGLSPEEWGGDAVFCEISAKENRGIEHLLEVILLQAEVLELKANHSIRVQGHVIEARVDPGKGPVATVLIQKGTLREGDPYVVGSFSGRVRAMFDDRLNRVKEAPPSMPIEITGIDGVPESGDPFHVVENEKYGREIALKRQHYKHITSSVQKSQPSLAKLSDWVQSHKELNLIIKADVQGSVEAIRDTLQKLSTEDVKVRVIHGSVGAIRESDINLASASSAIVLGFQVRATQHTTSLAEQRKVEIKYYNVIYDVVDDVKKAMEGMLDPDIVEEISGRAEVREIFRISRTGNIAGCKVISGSVLRNNKIRLLRDNIVIHTGAVRSLRRVKEDVTEVQEGFECGIALESYNDLHPGDQIESFYLKAVSRKL